MPVSRIYQDKRPFAQNIQNVLIFALHQVLATIGVAVGTAFVVFAGAALIHGWRPEIDNKMASAVLTETPFFPIQTIAALLAGFSMMRLFRHVAILWIWVLPAFVMLIAMIHGPIAQIGIDVRYNPISHFFGQGCKPQNRCFDQTVFTLLLYTAIGYSVGGRLCQLLMRHVRRGAAAE